MALKVVYVTSGLVNDDVYDEATRHEINVDGQLIVFDGTKNLATYEYGTWVLVREVPPGSN